MGWSEWGKGLNWRKCLGRTRMRMSKLVREWRGPKSIYIYYRVLYVQSICIYIYVYVYVYIQVVWIKCEQKRWKRLRMWALAMDKLVSLSLKRLGEKLLRQNCPRANRLRRTIYIRMAESLLCLKMHWGKILKRHFIKIIRVMSMDYLWWERKK